MRGLAKSQRGITFWGLCFLLGSMGAFLLFGLKAYPLIQEKYTVIGILKSIASRPDAKTLSEAELRTYFIRNINVTNILRFTEKNLKDYMQVEKAETKGDRVINFAYDSSNSLFWDLHLKLEFRESVLIGSTGE